MNRELFDLSLQSLRRKKRSSLLLFAVLFLSFAFAIVSLTVTGSIQETNREYLFDTYGTWYGAIPSGAIADESFLRQQEWLDKLGICVSYGEIHTGSRTGSIGTVDDDFLQIGRISLQDGRFPSNAGEIAMEADLLSALGYDYTLGQEITFTVSVSAGKSPVLVEQSFTLCGIIREYADLWVRSHNSKGRLLNSAIITQDAADSLRHIAQETAEEAFLETEDGEADTPVLDSLVPQYHFSVLPGYEEEATEQVNSYLGSHRHDDLLVSLNLPILNRIVSNESYDAFYAGVILVVTMLSIICIHVIRFQDEARQMSVFRSIGVTRHQLCRMLFYETLCLALPAIVLGVGAAYLGIWVLLRLAVYSGSAPIRFSLPISLLVSTAVLWLAGILIARLAVFLIALRTPLTGRLYIPRKKARRYRMMQQFFIIALSSLLCTTILFTGLESLNPYRNMTIWDSYPDYEIYYSGHEKVISKEMTMPLKQVPGVSSVWGFGEVQVPLSFDGMDSVPMVKAQRKEWEELYGTAADSDTMTVYLFIVDESDWENTVDFRSTGIDMKKFRNGDAVLVSLLTDSAGTFITEAGSCSFEESGISAGDTIYFTMRSGDEVAKTAVEVGGIHRMKPNMSNRTLASMWSNYTIIGSEEFLKKLLDSLEPGQKWGAYGRDKPYGYGRVHIYTDHNAEYLSTDAVLAEICTREEEMNFSSQREIFEAYVQEYLQVLILLFTVGGCIVLVVLLILGNTLAMESERMKRPHGILQAIGMSRHQLWIRQFRTALSRGVIGTVIGWLIYGGYCFVYAIQQKQSQTEFGEVNSNLAELAWNKIHGTFAYDGDLRTVLLLSALCIILLLAISWLANRRLTKEDLMAKLRDEH